MSEKSSETSFPASKRERLVAVFNPKRVSYIFYYVFSFVLFIIGLTFMVATAQGAILRDFESWILSSIAMIVALFLFVWAESRHFFTLYIITTWNVRIRKGVFKRRTIRVYYDDISECRTTSDPEEKRVGMGDVEICSKRAKENPVIVFDEVHNPDGVREIISRFIQTIPDPIPWSHMER